MNYRAALFLALAVVEPGVAQTTVRPALTYSQAFGGSLQDTATAVAADSSGNSYVTGFTTSPDFPVQGGFQSHLAGTPLRVSTDSGNTWSLVNILAGVISIAGSPNQPGVLYAGTIAGLYRSADSGNTWSPVTTLGPVYIHQVLTDTSDGNIVYVVAYEGVFKSQDGGATWSGPLWSSLAPPGVPFNGNLVASPGKPMVLFTFGDTPYRSSDGGATWTALPPFSDYSVAATAFDPSNPNVMYTMGRQGFYRSTDLGYTWTTLGGPLPGAARNYPEGLAVTPMAFYAAADNGVFQSTDGGATWTATSITAKANAVFADPNNPQVLYANADRVYRTVVPSNPDAADASTGRVSRSTGLRPRWSVILTPVLQPIQMLAVLPTVPTSLFAGSDLAQDVFVTKLSPDGKQILYSTYLGGSGFDFPTAIAVDSSGNAYVTGYTYSADFPVTAGALQPKLAGPFNGFLAKISADGSALLYSTFLGGSTGDAANGVALDSAGNVYLTGWAGSADFPITANALQPQLRQGCPAYPGMNPSDPNYQPPEGDAFVTKIAADGSALLHSTFLGGTCGDAGKGIAVDASGSAYVAGITNSPDFPTTKGSYQPAYASWFNSGFLAKLTPGGDGLVYATFIGGPGDDVAEAVAVDGAGNAYVTGATYGLDSAPYCCYPSVSYQDYSFGFSVQSGGFAYVAKLNPAGSARVFANYQGRFCDTGTSVAADKAGDVWIGGATGYGISGFFGYFVNGGCGIADVPTMYPFQGGGLGLGFVSEISPDGGTVLFSSLLDGEPGMALDPGGNAYVAGWTTNTDLTKQVLNGYPVTSALALRIQSATPSPVSIQEPAYYVAPGSLVTITGSGLGPSQQVGMQTGSNGLVTTTLASATVTFNGIPAPLISVQDQQVVCVAPFELAGLTSVTVQVTNNGVQSNAIRVPLWVDAVRILSVANQDGTLNSATNPAAMGSVVTVYLTGMGPTNPPGVDGQINGTDARTFASSAQVLIGGSLPQVIPGTYKVWSQGPLLPVSVGPAPGQVAGISQVQVTVPVLAASNYSLGDNEITVWMSSANAYWTSPSGQPVQPEPNWTTLTGVSSSLVLYVQ